MQSLSLGKTQGTLLANGNYFCRGCHVDKILRAANGIWSFGPETVTHLTVLTFSATDAEIEGWVRGLFCFVAKHAFVYRVSSNIEKVKCTACWE